MKTALEIYIVLIPIIFIWMRHDCKKDGIWTIGNFGFSFIVAILNPISLFLLVIYFIHKYIKVLVNSSFWDKKLPDWF